MAIKWKIFVDNSEAVLDAKDTKYEIKLTYYDPEKENKYQNTVWIPVKGIEGMKAIENGTSVKPFQNSGVDAYFTFTPSESAEYIYSLNEQKMEKRYHMLMPTVIMCDIVTFSL